MNDPKELVNHKDTFIKMIDNLIGKYEYEGDYYMDDNNNTQLRTTKDVIADLEKLKSLADIFLV